MTMKSTTLHLHTQLALRLDQYGLVLVELTMALTANHQIAVVVAFEPSDVILGGKARVENDGGGGLAHQVLNHLGQRARLARIACEDLTSFGKSTPVEH